MMKLLCLVRDRRLNLQSPHIFPMKISKKRRPEEKNKMARANFLLDAIWLRDGDP